MARIVITGSTYPENLQSSFVKKSAPLDSPSGVDGWTEARGEEYFVTVTSTEVGLFFVLFAVIAVVVSAFLALCLRSRKRRAARVNGRWAEVVLHLIERDVVIRHGSAVRSQWSLWSLRYKALKPSPKAKSSSSTTSTYLQDYLRQERSKTAVLSHRLRKHPWHPLRKEE